ncbi:MAG TPA: hypothetical protein VMI34_01450 [Candidatus Bathyarchaeia archaeon]|nr:hypothetical protein [Candidatus Bathyarchaeia archaeon]
MVIKWTLLFFAVLSVALVVLTKLISFLNPPRPGRPRPPVLRRLERTLRWSVLIPAVIGLVVLVVTLWLGA